MTKPIQIFPVDGWLKKIEHSPNEDRDKCTAWVLQQRALRESIALKVKCSSDELVAAFINGIKMPACKVSSRQKRLVAKLQEIVDRDYLKAWKAGVRIFVPRQKSDPEWLEKLCGIGEE